MITQSFKCKIKVGNQTTTRDVSISGYSYKNISEAKSDYEKGILKEFSNAIITWIE